MSEPQDQDQAQLYQQIIAKCWTDEDFKQQLLAEPMATLKAEGLDLPEDLSVKVLMNTKEVFYMVIPAKPTELSLAEMDLLAAGATLAIGAANFIPMTEREDPADMIRPRNGIGSKY